MIYFPLVIVVLVLSFFLQEFCPILEWAYHARLLLVQTVFYCVAITLPYPLMLLSPTPSPRPSTSHIFW